MRILILSLLGFLGIGYQTNAQMPAPKVIASGGGFKSGGGMSVSWTVGETFVKSVSGGGKLVTEGFQYPVINNSTLSNLTISNGTLAPVFQSSVTNYTANVPNNIAVVTLTPTATDATAVIKVNSTTVPSGNTSGNILLNVGDNTVTTIVTLPGGIITTYTIIITRQSNTPPIISSQAFSINENAPNATPVGIIAASDPDAGQILTYSITAGNSGNAFTLTGNQLRVNNSAALDFETKPTFSLTILATDNGSPALSKSAIVTVNLNNLNDNAPVIVSNGGGAATTTFVPENTTEATTVTATDADEGANITYSITGGTDASKFSINSLTGALRFITAPDFELPTDNNADNTYNVFVTASDGTYSVQQTIAVTVTDVTETVANRPPVITSNGGGAEAFASLPENSIGVTTVIASDPDAGTTIVYSLNGGPDAALFAINSSNGALTFATAPNFESPADAGADNVYNVIVRASDGAGGTDDQAISLTITNINEPPVITSNGGGAAALISLPENSTTITNLTAVDPDAATIVRYSLNGGADAAKFAINPSTGALTFIAPPDFEMPLDAGTDNVYDVTVRASDGQGGTDDQAISVTITNLNELPVITSNQGGTAATVFVAENTTAVTIVSATDPDAGTTITYALNGGSDAGKFKINASTGALSFINSPDYENPTNAAANNVYDVIVRASDGNGGTDDQSIAVNVTNINEPPVITSNGGGAIVSVSVLENTTLVTKVTATDPDAGTTISYTLNGGADAAKFAINGSTGDLTFLGAPNYELPTDVGTNNVYDVVVKAVDGAGGMTDQVIAVTIVNVNELPVISSSGGGNTAELSIPENSRAVTTVAASDPDAGTTITYSISGGADAAKFSINPVNGTLTFITAPNFEIPTDAGNNNTYDVVVVAGDGSGGTDDQSIAVTITDVNESPVISSNGGGLTAAISVPENFLQVTTVVATDPDAGATVTLSLSGADAAKFTITPSTGALTFITAPDYENPADIGANNVYDIIVKASDGINSTQQTIVITVTNTNDNLPVITSDGGGGAAAISVAENTKAVTVVTATDADAGTTLTYNLNGGVDVARFSIHPSTGALTFIAAPDFETPLDAGKNNVYDVIVQVNDGTNSTQQAISVTITDVAENTTNQPPVITSNEGGSTATVPVRENTIIVTTVTATDADAGTNITYSITGGADAGKFSIGSTTGVLNFIVAPNFEVPADADLNNTYDVVVRASDGAGGTDEQAIAVLVTNINEPPVITFNGGASASVSVTENTTAVTTITAIDPDAGTSLNYSISANSGGDGAKFSVNIFTGALSFISAPDYENPTDIGTNNVYDVVVRVSDGTNFVEQAIAITVTNLNDNIPVITSNGGGASGAISLPENTLAVTRVNATDADAGTIISYSFNGGPDAGRFVINGSTGVITFVTAPDFEAPSDADANNTYIVTVRASDGVNNAQQTLTITIGNVNDNPPVITSNNGGSNASVSIPENTTAVTKVTANDADAGTIITYALNGGADAARFAVNGSTGILNFVTAPDFEAPADSDGNNTYIVVVGASDGTYNVQQTITVTVTNVAESANQPPVIMSNGGGASAATFVSENTKLAATVTATDPDAGNTVTYSINGGADATRFAINNSTGALTFINVPDFEIPGDVGANNIYDVVVMASDGAGGTDEQSIAITVTNLNEPPVITSNGGGANATIFVAENTILATTIIATDPDAGAILAYSLNGGVDVARFTVNASTGALTFINAPNFEIPTDANTNNVYEVNVVASDGVNSVQQAIAVTVTNLNDNNPVITSNGGGAAAAIIVAENTKAVTVVVATDADTGTTIIYNIVAGNDAAKFNIDASTGALAFIIAPDFENPTDVGGNNVYNVIVTAGDGANIVQQAIAVTVTDVAETPANQPPVITSNGAGATAAVSVVENTTAVTTVTATNPSGTTLTYSLNGGIDAALFTIHPSTGALKFISAPDFEAPADADGNNTYVVTVRASDGTNSAQQTITVAVTDVAEAPINQPPLITSNGGSATAAISMTENKVLATTVTATDPDEGTTITFSLNGGADFAKFSINASTGDLSFIAAPNFEGPTDAGLNNVYDVIVRASDGAGGTDDQAIAITVTNINEPPVITSNGGAAAINLSAAENTRAVTTVAASDPDAGATVTYSLTGGADISKFVIGSLTGALSFITAPDYEMPTDADGNNTYVVVVNAGDGNSNVQQTITVVVTDVVETPPNQPPVITSNNGGNSASVGIPENSLVVTTVTASDPNPGNTISYSLDGGVDAAKFSIDASSGVLSFIAPPDFEIPGDAGANNVYDVVVKANDGAGGTDDQALAVTVTNVNEPPSITSNGGAANASIPVAENSTTLTTVKASDPDAGTTITYTINGGADASRFVIGANTGALSFITAPNFENATDANKDNLYEVIVGASDGTNSVQQAIAATVTNVNEPPLITSNGGGATTTTSIPENSVSVTTVVAADQDAGAIITYSLNGGADAAKFSISAATGTLVFVAPPDFEVPGDADHNNTYDVIVGASDGTHAVQQAIAVSVLNVNDNTPVITSNGGDANVVKSVSENTTAVTTVMATDADAGSTITYSLNGGADAAKFSVNPVSGVVIFISAPDFEVPGDVGGDNVYNVIVKASDGANSVQQAIAVTVTDVSENPEAFITFSGKVLLQGAYSGTEMSNTLNTSGMLQSNAAAQPYNNTRFGYSGAEAVGANFFASNRGIVDWVLIDLRTVSGNVSTIVATRAAFVKSDGTIVETEGSNTRVTFQGMAPGNYYVSIRHRCHLGIRSSVAVDFTGGAGSYDFTTAANQSYQNLSYTSTVQVAPNVWAMRGGDANSDKSVKYNGPNNDQNQVLNITLGGSLSMIRNNEYRSEDVNLDGVIKYNGPGNDQNFLLNTILGGLLSNIYNEQL